MAEDWALSATSPPFTLFKNITPEEAAQSDELVEMIVYNRWKKQERRRYSKLKIQKLAEMMNTKKKEELDELSELLGEQLTFFKATVDNLPELDDLIAKVESLKVNGSTATNVKSEK